MKKLLKIIGVAFLVLIIFRGFFYRLLVKYDDVGSRAAIEITHPDLIKQIEAQSANRKMDLEAVVEIAEDITTDQLQFTTGSASNDPNVLVHSKRANCVGYAAMFNSIANHLVRTHHLEAEIAVKHKIGKLSLLGFNLHSLFENSFFRDHDFVEIEDKGAGDAIFVDPSVSDYLWIGRVAGRN